MILSFYRNRVYKGIKVVFVVVVKTGERRLDWLLISWFKQYLQYLNYDIYGHKFCRLLFFFFAFKL